MELARHDQSRVNLSQCRRFNRWRVELKAYDELGPLLSKLRPARPINRWIVMGGFVILGLFGLFFFGRELGQNGVRILSFSLTVSLILLYFLPESLYGTTVEMIEGRVLRVVERLEELLFSGDMELSEAVFFKVKDDLEAARRELRQQIHLAHRW